MWRTVTSRYLYVACVRAKSTRYFVSIRSVYKTTHYLVLFGMWQVCEETLLHVVWYVARVWRNIASRCVVCINSVEKRQHFNWYVAGLWTNINTRFWCRLCALSHDVERRGRSWFADVDSWWNGPGVCLGRKSRWTDAMHVPRVIGDLAVEVAAP